MADVHFSPAALSQILASDPTSVRLLDVRTPGEYQASHIAGAYNVPIDMLAEHAAEIRRLDSPVVLICQSGQRATRAEAVLADSGMRQLHVLHGGMRAWLDAGLPVNRGKGTISLERQVRIVAGSIAGTGGFLALFVNPLFAILPAFVGTGLVFAGVTDICAMGMLLTKLPWNRSNACDVSAAVRALRN